MQDSIGKIFAVFLAVAILFVYPIINMYEQQDISNRQYVMTETAKFVDSIRNIGYITPNMYREYSQSLSATNNLYKIEMEHSHRVYDPVFDDPTDITTYHDDYNTYFMGYFSDEILDVLFPESGGEGGKYYMSEGDYILVKISNSSKTIATKAKELIFSVNLPSEVIYVRYGGMVKNEAD